MNNIIFMCTCRGDGKGGHSERCFNDSRNHCSECNAFLCNFDGTFKPCEHIKIIPEYMKAWSIYDR